MFELNVLNNQIIIDKDIVLTLRQQVKKASLDNDFLGSNLTFIERLEAQITYHLRGLDLEVKQLVKEIVFHSPLFESDSLLLTQANIADLILTLDLPMERKIKNFQNWITMSTDYTLNFEEVSKLVLTASYSDPLPQEIQADVVQLESFKPTSTINNPTDEETFLTAVPNEFIDLDDFESYSHEGLEDVHESTEDFYDSEIDDHDNNDWHSHSSAVWLQALQAVFSRYKKRILYLSIAAICSVGLGFGIGQLITKDRTSVNFSEACHLMRQAKPNMTELQIVVQQAYAHHSAGMPNSFEFKAVNVDRLNGYLKRRNSILATEPYFSAILRAAALNDVNPVLLFAITGQEQGFVRLDDPDALTIANNPFNVYHSWRDYNTNVEDAAHIAAGTIQQVLVSRPENENPFVWLNQKYAEDANWWKGVEVFFIDIENYIGL